MQPNPAGVHTFAAVTVSAEPVGALANCGVTLAAAE